MSTNPFKDGAIHSLPICVSFSLIFFSLGSLYKSVRISMAEGTLSTIVIFAAPLQIASVQDLISLNIIAIIVLSLLINFRFLLMSSVMTQYFTKINRFKIILSLIFFSASSYSVTHNHLQEHKNLNAQEQFQFYLGVSVPSYLVAVFSTILGYFIADIFNYQLLLSYTIMLIPIHFISLMALRSSKSKGLNLAVIATFSGIFMAPLINEINMQSIDIIVPIIFGIVVFFIEKARIMKC